MCRLLVPRRFHYGGHDGARYYDQLLRDAAAAQLLPAAAERRSWQPQHQLQHGHQPTTRRLEQPHVQSAGSHPLSAAFTDTAISGEVDFDSVLDLRRTMMQ